MMEFPKCRLEFGIASLSDIRLLMKAWRRHLVAEGLQNTGAILVNVMVDDRRPEEEISINFIAAPKVVERFLVKLKDQGLKFTREDLIPGLFNVCRVVHERW